VLVRYPNHPLNIELKSRDVGRIPQLCSLLAEFDRKRSVIIASTSGVMLEAVRTQCPEVATSASIGEGLWFVFLYYIGLSETFNARMQALQLPRVRLLGFELINKGLIEAAHERNLDVHVFTINEDPLGRKLIKDGANGLMTDRPSLDFVTNQ